MSAGYLLSTSAINVFIHLSALNTRLRDVEAEYGCFDIDIERRHCTDIAQTECWSESVHSL